jgi:hypothetical protein
MALEVMDEIGCDRSPGFADQLAGRPGPGEELVTVEKPAAKWA